MEYLNGNLPITVDPETMGGIPVFRGTRVPVETLFDYLEDNHALEVFLDDFPTVSKEAAIAVLAHAERFTLDHVLA